MTIIAQAVAEYGLLDSLVLAGQKVSFAARAFVADAGPGTWTLVGAVVLGILWSLSRRS